MAARDVKQAEPPIDIAADKLIEWLQQRHKLDDGWQVQLRHIRDALNRLLPSLPLSVRTSVLATGDSSSLSLSYVHYWTVTQIMIALEVYRKEVTGARVKNWFGSYTDEDLRAWNDVIQSYKKNNVYLAEASRMITQYVTYDIPTLRRLIDNSQKQMIGLAKRSVEAVRSADVFQRRYDDACNKLGIRSISSLADMRTSLQSSTSLLPSLLYHVQSATRGDSVGDAIAYYIAFIQFTRNDASYDTHHIVATLRAIRTLAVDDTNTSTSISSSSLSLSSIPPGDSNSSNSNDVTIDWGIAIEASGEDIDISMTSATIDWGTSANDDANDSATNDVAAVIKWDDESAATTSSPSMLVPDNDTKRATSGVSLSSSDTSRSISLDDHLCRQKFMTDLLELESFLLQRYNELTDDSHTGATYSMSFTSSSSPLLLYQTATRCKEYLNGITSILSLLRDARLQQLLMIRSSSRYTDRLLATTCQLSSSSRKLRRSATDCTERVEALRHTIDSSERQLRAAMRMTRELKSHIEAAISTMFNGRTVHLFGEAATL